MPTFSTKLLENINFLGKIAYFGEKVDIKEGINLIKPSAQIPCQIKRNVKKKSLPFQIIHGTVPGMFDMKIHEFSF